MFLRVEDLRRRYGDRVALDGLSFGIERGQIYGLLGPNGAGKSTLFQILCGLRRADSGRLFLDGKPFDPGDPRQRLRIGVVFQEPSLDDLLTGHENLRCALALYGGAGKAGEARVEEVLKLLDLWERRSDPVGRYSGGMKRRLELGRVLLHHPTLLLMDEPSRGLDAAALRRYYEELVRLTRAEQLTILLTTHLPDEAEHCHRLGVLDAGRMIAEGAPSELLETVGGDVITISAVDAESVAAELKARLPAAFEVVHGAAEELVLLAPRAHELIPRLVECFPKGRLRSVAMRRPSLGDLFVKLTGRGLAVERNP